MAGRSLDKLVLLQQSLGPAAAKIPLIAADAEDPESLAKMCAQTEVVLSTVGPYTLYGEPLVKAVVQAGIGYCDLTGEPPWMRRMIDGYHDAARASGAHLVHAAGFDSIPSDLGVHFLQAQAKAQLGQYCEKVSMRVRTLKGGVSGGTAASLRVRTRMLTFSQYWPSCALACACKKDRKSVV